jgi:hypothetical protein
MNDYGLPPDVLAKIQALSGIPQQDESIAQRMRMAQMLLGQHAAQYTNPLATGIAGLGDALGHAIGSYQESSAQSDRDALQRTATEGRGAYANALGAAQTQLGAAGNALMGISPQAQEYQPANAAYQAAQQRLEGLVNMGTGLGDSVVSGLATGALSREEKKLADLLAMRKENREQDSAASKKALEAAQADALRAKGPNDHFTLINNPDGSQTKLNTLTGETFRIPGQSGGGGSDNPLAKMKPAQVEKLWKDLTDSLSTYRGRGNLNRDNQASLQRAEALERLFLGPNGDLVAATPQQVREGATALAGVISRGGSQAVSQIDELVPQTMASQWANIKQRLFNNPQDADAQAFVRNMLETAAREKKLVLEQIHKGQIQSLPNYADLRTVDRKRFDTLLKNAGIDPASVDDLGAEITQQPQASPAPPVPAPTSVGVAADPESTKALAWARAHPNDPLAPAVLAKLGVNK